MQTCFHCGHEQSVAPLVRHLEFDEFLCSSCGQTFFTEKVVGGDSAWEVVPDEHQRIVRYLSSRGPKAVWNLFEALPEVAGPWEKNGTGWSRTTTRGRVEWCQFVRNMHGIDARLMGEGVAVVGSPPLYDEPGGLHSPRHEPQTPVVGRDMD